MIAIYFSSFKTLHHSTSSAFHTMQDLQLNDYIEASILAKSLDAIPTGFTNAVYNWILHNHIAFFFAFHKLFSEISFYRWNDALWKTPWNLSLAPKMVLKIGGVEKHYKEEDGSNTLDDRVGSGLLLDFYLSLRQASRLPEEDLAKLRKTDFFNAYMRMTGR